MKYCKKCLTDIETAFVLLKGNLEGVVSPDRCEFWAHKALNESHPIGEKQPW